MEFPLITASKQLHELCNEWRQESIIAVDTEASSFHHYVVRLCLIQVTTAHGTWLLDPLKIEDLSPFLEILEDPNIVKVLHDADFDIRLFHREHGTRVAPLFDTRIAAQLIGEQHFSLQALLQKYLGKELDKKFQKADWLQRPLSQEMLDYAATDTYYLLELRNLLAARLEHMGRLEWALEEFEHVPDIPFKDEGPKEPSWLRIKWAKSLKGRQLAILRQVHGWREKEAEKRDRAPFMIMPNSSLIGIAKEAPKSIGKLKGIDSVSDRHVDRYGRFILDAVREACKMDKSEWPVLERPKRFKRDEEYDERLKRLKGARDQEAERLSLAQGVLCPNSILQWIARERPVSLEAFSQLDDYRKWQIQETSKAFLAVM